MRSRLTSTSAIDDVLTAINNAKKIIVITGAGISVSCGIPDFRSKDVGLYNNLDCASIGIPSAELLFDLEFFKIDPEPFYKYCHCLLPKHVVPSSSHKFIALLESKKQLTRNYTQNVDGIERMAGVKNVFECHGTMNEFKCISSTCKKRKIPLCELIDTIKDKEVCYCTCGEALKPSITFFNEILPSQFHNLMVKDVAVCDLVLVIGTSLKVGGSVHEILRKVAPTAPQILINKDEVYPPKTFSQGFDVSLLGNCDDIVEYLCSRLGWNLNERINASDKVGEKMVNSTSNSRSSLTTNRRSKSTKTPISEQQIVAVELNNETSTNSQFKVTQTDRQGGRVYIITKQTNAREIVAPCEESNPSGFDEVVPTTATLTATVSRKRGRPRKHNAVALVVVDILTTEVDTCLEVLSNESNNIAVQTSQEQAVHEPAVPDVVVKRKRGRPAKLKIENE